MATTIRRLPTRIIQAIEQEKLSVDYVIYYDNEYGWVCRQKDERFMNSISNLNEQNTCTTVSNDARPLEKLGPFGVKPTNISLTILENTEMYETILDEKLKIFKMLDGVGQHAPIVPVTLTRKARDMAYIPQEATHFCWVYPLNGLNQLTKTRKVKIEEEIANKNLEITLLSLGGFVYFRLEEYCYKMLQANCLVQADNGLTFIGPFQWRSAYTADLAKQGRFQNVNISSLLDFGIKYYCFINPNEKLKKSTSDNPDWSPAPNGGFIYLYDSKLRPHIYDRYFCISNKSHNEHKSTQVMPFSLIRKRKQSESLLTNNNLLTTSSTVSSSDADNQFKCSICLERTVRCIFIPCKHMCTCSECSQGMQNRNDSFCPICRQMFTEVWDVFL